MRIMAAAIALISLVLVLVNWDSALAIAWAVAFCGWVPHCFHDHHREIGHGH